jgi:hypothetical protein
MNIYYSEGCLITANSVLLLPVDLLILYNHLLKLVHDYEYEIYKEDETSIRISIRELVNDLSCCKWSGSTIRRKLKKLDEMRFINYTNGDRGHKTIIDVIDYEAMQDLESYV